MTRTASLALLAVWLVFRLPDPLDAPLALSLTALGAWLLCGRCAGIALALACWAALNATWILDDRLPVSRSLSDVLVTGTLCDFPGQTATARGGRVVRFRLEAESDPLSPGMPRRLLVSWYDPPRAPRIGERWQLKVRVRPPRGLSNAAGFDFERWSFHNRIGGTGYVRRSPLNRRLEALPWRCPEARWRGRVVDAVAAALAGHAATPYILGLVAGARHALSPGQWAVLRNTGTAHLMAISGLHVGLVAALFLWFGRQFGRLLVVAGGRCAPPALGRWLAVGAAAGYAGLAGFSVSTLRALLMIGIGALFSARRRVYSPADVLAAAVLAVLAVDPPAVLSSGFWLSFGAVAWLFLPLLGWSAPRVARSAPGRRWRVVGALLRAQWLLWVGLAPWVMAWFGQLPLLSPLANLLAVPVFSFVVVPGALSGAALLAFMPQAGQLVLQAVAAVVTWLLGVLGRLGAMPLAVWPATAIGGGAQLLATAACLALLWPRPVPFRGLAVLLWLPLLSGGGTPPAAGQFRVIVTDVGQGLAVVVQTSAGTLVYDSGPAFNGRDAGTTVVNPVLRYRGIRRLDALMVSHRDNDHSGGAASILEAHPEARLLAARRLGVPAADFSPCLRGLSWTWGGVDFTVLHPPPGSAPVSARDWSDNAGSCVLLVSSPFGSVLLPGDIPRRIEDRLVHGGLIGPVDLVLAAHHGSATSSGMALVRAAQPRYVVFSAGHGNRWGFPRSTVRQRWQAAGSCTLSTAEFGEMVFETGPAGRLALVSAQRLEGRRIWSYRPGRIDPCAGQPALL